jgi:hypothetical protein
MVLEVSVRGNLPRFGRQGEGAAGRSRPAAGRHEVARPSSLKVGSSIRECDWINLRPGVCLGFQCQNSTQETGPCEPCLLDALSLFSDSPRRRRARCRSRPSLTRPQRLRSSARAAVSASIAAPGAAAVQTLESTMPILIPTRTGGVRTAGGAAASGSATDEKGAPALLVPASVLQRRPAALSVAGSGNLR